MLHRPIIPVLHHAAGKAADITIFDPDTIGAKLCHKLPVFASEFTLSPDELNCRNGVLNLQTGELTPHHHSQRFLGHVNAAWDPDADYSEWEDFLLRHVEGSEEAYQCLKRALGYAITGHTREEALLYIYGDTRTGKGTLTETIDVLLGEPLCREIDKTTLTKDESVKTVVVFGISPLLAKIEI